MKYQPGLRHSLRNLTFEILPGQKCGIVGRTGAGKSSIVQVLFAASPHDKGVILIDGVDISKVSVRDLRLQLSVIPQNPFLFSTSIRNNLDPLGFYNLEQIERALAIAQLDNFIGENNLDDQIHELGLSLG